MRKSERLGLMLTPLEKSAALRLAEVEGGLSLAATVRRLIRKAAQERGLWPPHREDVQCSGPGSQEAYDD